jgi:hypothetical protein
LAATCHRSGEVGLHTALRKPLDDLLPLMWGESSRTANFMLFALARFAAGASTDEPSLVLGQAIKEGQHRLLRA